MLYTKMMELAQELNRMKRLKRGGLAKLPPGISATAGALVDELAKAGLFVVPVGELEEWLASREIRASKRSRSAWANEAAAKVRQLGAQSDDVWAFMRDVAGFVMRRL